MITIAVAKGRVCREVMPLLTEAGIAPTIDVSATRQLVIPTAQSDVRLIIVRSVDVPTYVAGGAAQVGIAGNDVIAEYQSKRIVCPLDLRCVPCRLVAASRAEYDYTYNYGKRIRVASKYPNIAKQWFLRHGVQADIIRLAGAMELAPQVGLSDIIVDLADTGETLRTNGLIEREVLMHVSAYLMFNRGAYATRRERLQRLRDQLAEAVRLRAEG